MNAYAMWDRAEDIREARHVRQVLIEEEEAELADWLDGSLKMNLFQAMFEEAFAGKLDHPASIRMAFDNDCKFQDAVSDFRRMVAETIAHYDVKIKHEEDN